MLGPFVLAVFAAYIAILGGVLYFCVFADPATSKIAHFFTVKLPQSLWARAEERLGSNIRVLQWFADRFLIIIYCFVVFGSWSIIFAYVFPWIDAQNHVSKVHKYIGVLVFAACVASWHYASGSSPGIITKDNIHIYDHFPYDGFMFAPKQICATRKIPKLARSKFDRHKYNENIPRFDHFCGWIHNTVGEENYRFFLLFLLVHTGMCIYGTAVLSGLFHGHIVDKGLLTATFFNRQTGEELKPGKFLIFQYLFAKFFPEMTVTVLMAVMALALGLFLAYHISLTSRGLTTNEAYKWSQVKKWHKTELRLYNEAVKNGDIVPREEGDPSSFPKADDGDVTCAGGTPEDQTATAEIGEDEIINPGPPPVNIYNRGFIENWKEVIFPLSIRKRRSKNKAI